MPQAFLMIAFLLVGGVVADRIPKPFVLVYSDAARALAISVIAVLSFFHLLQLWELIVLALFFGLTQGFFRPFVLNLSNVRRSLPPMH